MFAKASVGRHIAQLPAGVMFCTRDVLKYGSRNAIDQALWHFVKIGFIDRVARGLFIKPGRDTEYPTIDEIAVAKAAAFGRSIWVHGAVAAGRMNISPCHEKPHTYATNGGTTSFLAGQVRIFLKRCAPRKAKPGDRKCGLVIRALWSVGKDYIEQKHLCQAWLQMTRDERQKLRNNWCSVMPAWLTDRLFFSSA